ncbi:spore coat protein YsxE [Alkalihalobacterium elongatum]|uniref:spore coat protein YsxE n=1 Tax=Alkalihalobacterium elongatum TaxID=2675466 RepID=UPI001C1FEA1A|nr:spore coat protein YsxE [Alkalihalobacterium elongatum]
MTNRSILDRYAPILFHYDLYPEYIEDWGKVKQVKTSHGMFALKEAHMTRQQGDAFVQVMRKLDRLGYRQLIPILPTKYGEYVLSTEDRTYYLMPWIEEEPYQARTSREEKIIDQLGVIHRLTAKTEEYPKETIDEAYQKLLQRWDMRRLELERFADEAEGRTYISPFQLTYLTHVHQMLLMVEDAKRHLKNWYDICVEKGSYRTVLCHGRASRNHTIFNANGDPILFNFERASMDTPARDLALFCRQSFGYNLWNEEEMVRWFGTYDRNINLLDEEKELLFGYLCFPEPVLFSIQLYLQQKQDKPEIYHVQRLEKRFHMMRKVQRLKGYLIKTETQTPQFDQK